MHTCDIIQNSPVFHYESTGGSKATKNFSNAPAKTGKKKDCEPNMELTFKVAFRLTQLFHDDHQNTPHLRLIDARPERHQ